MPREKAEERRRLRPLWSGTISFGLVSLPVSMFAANRGRSATMRLVDDAGTPLTRRYFCPEEERELTSDEIVRGYEYEKDSFVIVTDEELESLAPDKSQEIDLRRFVEASQIDPVFFERAYFLAPDKGGAKAYRLLARAMEERQRAGLATFVMRGKEYLVAILSENGILRAETLRFGDELRTPADIGLPELPAAEDDRVSALSAEIESLERDELSEELLVDQQARRLRDLVEAKLASGEDVVSAPEDAEPDEEEGEAFVDLMRLLKESLDDEEAVPAGGRRGGGQRGKGSGSGRGRRSPSPRRDSAGAARKKGGEGGADAPADLLERSRSELYEQARELDIAGRSKMSKEELIDAIRRPH